MSGSVSKASSTPQNPPNPAPSTSPEKKYTPRLYGQQDSMRDPLPEHCVRQWQRVGSTTGLSRNQFMRECAEADEFDRLMFYFVGHSPFG